MLELAKKLLAMLTEVGLRLWGTSSEVSGHFWLNVIRATQFHTRARQAAPARGLTWALDDPPPYWLQHEALRTSVGAHRKSALMMQAFRGA